MSKFRAYYDKRNEKRRQQRSEMLERLGNKCARCGFSDPRALQIDHVNGNGNDHYHLHGTLIFYRLVMENKNDEFQLLCANCNWIKRDENYELQMVNRANKALKVQLG